MRNQRFKQVSIIWRMGDPEGSSKSRMALEESDAVYARKRTSGVVNIEGGCGNMITLIM